MRIVGAVSAAWLSLLLASCWSRSSLAFAPQWKMPERSPVVSSGSRRRDSNVASSSRDRRLHSSSATLTTEPINGFSGAQEEVEHADAVVCGGGPAGLLTAIMLARNLPPTSSSQKTTMIRVYDRLSAPPSPDDETVWGDIAKFYLLGLGGRGQSALKHHEAWDEVQARCVPVLGRMDWAPDSSGEEEGVERIFDNREKGVTTQVLPRDKLVGASHEHIVSKCSDRIQLNYGHEVRPIDFECGKDNSQCLIQVSKCSEETSRLNPSAVKTSAEKEQEIMCDTDTFAILATDLLVAADGTVRTVANAMERKDKARFQSMNPAARLFAGAPFCVKRHEDDNQRVCKTIPVKLPKDWRSDLNCSARCKDGRIVFDALPANSKGGCCGVLLIKKDDPLAQADTNPATFRAAMDECLPQFSAILDDATIASVAKKPVSYLPSFRHAGPRLHQGNRCVILGDCAHAVKPYFGLGANGAMEDVKIFESILNSTASSAKDGKKLDLTAAVHEHSRRQAPEARALVRISRSLDRPGKLGFATFVLPLILDSIFFNMLPSVFRPNVIRMLQNEKVRFRQVARRKRLDRLGQVAILGTGLTLTTMAAKFVLTQLAKALGRKTSTVTAVATMSLIAAGVMKQFLAKFLVNDLAPADIIARLSKKENKDESAEDFTAVAGSSKPSSKAP